MLAGDSMLDKPLNMIVNFGNLRMGMENREWASPSRAYYLLACFALRYYSRVNDVMKLDPHIGICRVAPSSACRHAFHCLTLSKFFPPSSI
ncbi:hypothetical protein ATY78_26965 [Rhizobium sp. R635]|nr:hypothetical protein ATY78_26965 [Rhizobium sp. R635]